MFLQLRLHLVHLLPPPSSAHYRALILWSVPHQPSHLHQLQTWPWRLCLFLFLFLLLVPRLVPEPSLMGSHPQHSCHCLHTSKLSSQALPLLPALGSSLPCQLGPLGNRARELLPQGPLGFLESGYRRFLWSQGQRSLALLGQLFPGLQAAWSLGPWMSSRWRWSCTKRQLGQRQCTKWRPVRQAAGTCQPRGPCSPSCCGCRRCRVGREKVRLQALGLLQLPLMKPLLRACWVCRGSHFYQILPVRRP